MDDVELVGENKEKMEKMIRDAIRIANDNNYLYSQKNRDKKDVQGQKNYRDCSSFVSRLYDEFFGDYLRSNYGFSMVNRWKQLFNT